MERRRDHGSSHTANNLGWKFDERKHMPRADADSEHCSLQLSSNASLQVPNENSINRATSRREGERPAAGRNSSAARTGRWTERIDSRVIGSAALPSYPHENSSIAATRVSAECEQIGYFQRERFSWIKTENTHRRRLSTSGYLSATQSALTPVDVIHRGLTTFSQESSF